jgi:FkbM family methyltransferase
MATKYNIKAIGGEMVLDDCPVSKRLQKIGIYEPLETALFKRTLKPSDVFLDIGAHIGYYSLIASKIIKTGMIHAFEPYVDSHELLMENLALNKCDNVDTHLVAVKDKAGMESLYIDEKNKGNNSLYSQKDCDEITVETIKLDDMFAGQKVDFVKIDTQGLEIEVLIGMQDVIKNNKLKIIIEYYPYGLRRMGHKGIDFFRMLNALGFDIYKIKAGSLAQIFDFRKFSMSVKSHTNLYCIKR